MNIGKFYQKAVRELRAAGIKTAELDTKVLLKFVLENDETFLLMHPEMPLTNYQLEKLNKLVKKRLNNEPIAYLTGHKEFFGHDFLVNKNVLIPRPESEFLVEKSLEYLKLKIENCKLKILDMGTGSGCIIISLALELEKQLNNGTIEQLRFFASDISKSALNVAKRNAKKLLSNSTIQQYNNLRFYRSDLFSNHLLHKKYDLIIANLPYVPSRDLGLGTCDSIKFEPQDAIFANDNGSAIIKKFLIESKKYLNYDGVILLELDPRNADQIHNFAKKNFPAAIVKLKKDLAGLSRYLEIKNVV